MSSFRLVLTVATVAFFSMTSSASAEPTAYTLEIKNHTFSPDVLTVPANTPFVLIIKNLDATPEEFESEDLSREKIIAGNSEGRINIAPLKAGTHTFFGEFNPKTAQGKIIAQ